MILSPQKTAFLAEIARFQGRLVVLVGIYKIAYEMLLQIFVVAKVSLIGLA